MGLRCCLTVRGGKGKGCSEEDEEKVVEKEEPEIETSIDGYSRPYLFFCGDAHAKLFGATRVLGTADGCQEIGRVVALLGPQIASRLFSVSARAVTIQTLGLYPYKARPRKRQKALSLLLPGGVPLVPRCFVWGC